MPAEAAEKLDTATLKKAVAWSLRYLLDPKRGAGKLPTIKEIKQQFPEIISTDQIENWIRNLVSKANIEEVFKDTQKVAEVLARLEEEAQTAQGSAARIPYSRPTAAPPTKRVGGLGVLAELETIEPILRKHNLETSAKIAQSLKPQVQSLITSLGTKDLPQDQFENLSRQIAQEVTRETLENVPKIADLAQIPDVITDSIVQTLLVDPVLASKLTKLSEVKLVEKTAAAAAQITQEYQKDLEKSAVLGSLAEIAQLQKPNQETLETISDHVQQIVESHAPLTTPGNQQIITASLGTYLVSYLDEVKKQLPQISATSLPTFENLQKIKEAAHNKATAQVGTIISQTKGAEQVERQIGYKTLTGNLAVAQRLAPPKVLPQQTLHLATGSGLILSSDKNLSDAQLSLLAHDQEWFNKELKKTTSQIENFQKRKTLSYQERKEKAQTQIKFAKLQKAQELRAKNPKRQQAYLNLLRNRTDVSRASYNARSLFNERQGYFMPRTIVNSPRFGPRFAFATIAPGSLSLFGKIAPGFSFSTSQLAPAFGMGISTVAPISPQSFVAKIASNTFGRVIKYAGLSLGGLALYFAALGGAALKGFLIGAVTGGTVGAGVGAVIGFQIGVALAPFTFGLSIPIFTLLGGVAGGLVGASIGGIAGGLIGYGLAAGSTTAISTGVGAGVGGTVGGYVGAGIGGSIGATIGTALAPFTFGLSIPIFTALGAALGAVVGAYLGSIIGAALGYAIGHYVLTTLGAIGTGAALGFFFGGPLGAALGAGIGWLATGGWIQIKNFFTGAPSAVTGAGAGFFGATAGFFTGLASTIWGGLSAAGGAIVGFFGGIGNFIVGGLGSLAVPASAAMIPVAGSIGAVAVGGTIVGIVTAATFFNPEGEFELPPAGPPGENQFVTLEKTVFANKLRLGPDKSIRFANDELPEPLKFEVKVKPKTNLTDLNCSDRLTLTKQGGTRQEIPLPAIPPCPIKLDAGQEFSFSFELTAEAPKYENALVTNTFSVSGLGESGGNLDFNIPFRDTNVKVIDEANVKNPVANNPNWPNNFVNTACPGGLTCWDYVKEQSIAGGVNPAFVLAVWIAESGASHYSGHLSCPNGGIGLSHTIEDLTRSVSCFVDLANNFASDQFAQMIDTFCDPATPEICQEPPNPPKTFLASLKSWYSTLVPIGNYGALIPISSGGVPVSFSQSVTATVLIGEAPISDPQGWPTCGYIGQGPYTSFPRSHSSSPFRPSMDIWNNIGTKIYATHEGTVIAAGFEYTNAIYVATRGVNYTTSYVHLLTFNPALYIGKWIDTGTLIGYMDTTGAYAGGVSHLHYMIYDKNGAEISPEQFNSLVPPYKEGDTVTSSWGPC